MKSLPFLKPLAALALIAVLAIGGYFTRAAWLPLLNRDTSAQSNEVPTEITEAAPPASQVILSDQAVANLGLTAKAVKPQTYWKSIHVPGMVIDRPGRSDRGVVSPVSGVVATIHVFPGDIVRPGELLFTIRLLSESLHQTQSELFKATQDIKLAEAQRKRLSAAGGAIPEARIIEVENQITRLEVSVQAYRRELSNRGLTNRQIDDAAQGRFASETSIVLPTSFADAKPPVTPVAVDSSSGLSELPAPTFAVQELKVGLGEPVEAGDTLCMLANHQLLAIEGRAFRDETPLLERSVKEGWPVEVDFQENVSTGWPALDQTFRIQYLANTIDPVNRTFAFLMPLENQSRVVEVADGTQMLWRYRPGQKVRLMIRVEKLENVFVLPAEAVVRESAEAYVFTQNVNTFERKPVRVVHQDRRYAVVPNDGSLPAGAFVVQNAAAQLNRMVKAGSASDLPEGYHIHADGSLHKNEN